LSVNSIIPKASAVGKK